MDESLKYLSKENTYSILGVMLYAASNNPNYALLNELAYLLDNQSFVNLLKYFEGQTITFPTWGETDRALKTLLVHQYYRIEGNSWKRSLELAGFAESESRVASTLLQNFERILGTRDFRKGGLRNVIKGSSDFSGSD